MLTAADLCHPSIALYPFTREGWLFEHKHDGFRAFVRKGDGKLELRSRSGRSLAHAFPEVVAAMVALPDATLDAELVVPAADGRSDFEELRRRARYDEQRPALR